MALPSQWQTSTIQATYVDLSGGVVVGTVTFTPRVANVLVGDTFVVTIPLTVALVSGALDAVIPATDDPDITPNGWTYQVQENWDGGRSYDIQAPVGQTVDLADYAPVPGSQGIVNLRGPAGPAGSVVVGAPLSYTLNYVSSWTQSHTFGYLPEVRLVDTGGNSVGCGVTYPDSSHVHITFPTPFSGTVVLS